MRARFPELALSLIVFFLWISQSEAADPNRGGVIVLGTGPGRQCYIATETDPAKLPVRAALEICDEAVADGGASTRDRAAAYVNRSFVKLQITNYAGVLADSDHSIALMPTMGEAYLNRGAALIGLQRYDEAIQALDKGLEVGLPAQQLVYFDRGVAKEYLHDVKGAYLDYKKAVEIDPRFQLASDQLTRFTVVPAHGAQ